LKRAPPVVLAFALVLAMVSIAPPGWSQPSLLGSAPASINGQNGTVPLDTIATLSCEFGYDPNIYGSKCEAHRVGCEGVPVGQMHAGLTLDFTAANSQYFAEVVSRLTNGITEPLVFAHAAFNSRGYNFFTAADGGNEALSFGRETDFAADSIAFIRLKIVDFQIGDSALCAGQTGGFCAQGDVVWEIWGSPRSTTPSPCSVIASGDSVTFQWSSTPGAEGYHVYLDDALVTTTTDLSYTRSSLRGDHEFCVEGFASGPQTSERCCQPYHGDAPMRSRISWGTCSPQINDQEFVGPGVYSLVISVEGAPTTSIGHDTVLRIHPAVPDAWRFDAGGCQTGERLTIGHASLGDSCPAMAGANPLVITSYFIDVDGSAELRLAMTYDAFSTLENQRYVLWKIGFDQTHTVAGSDADPVTCDGGSVPLHFTVAPRILLTGGVPLSALPESQDLPTTWNGGQVRTQVTTWGSLKALYRQ